MSGDFLTVGGVAAELGSSKGHVFGEVKAGRLKAAKINDRGDLRIYRPWLIAYIERSATEPRNPTEREIEAARVSAAKRAARRAAAQQVKPHSVPQPTEAAIR